MLIDFLCFESLPSLPPEIVADLIGIPYRLDGRGPYDYDCAGLFVEVQRRLGWDVEIPATPRAANSKAFAMIRILSTRWCERTRPVPGCCVFFPNELHVGTMLDGVRFLHTSEEHGAAFVDGLDGPQWAHKRCSFFTPVRGRHNKYVGGVQ